MAGREGGGDQTYTQGEREMFGGGVTYDSVRLSCVVKLAHVDDFTHVFMERAIHDTKCVFARIFSGTNSQSLSLCMCQEERKEGISYTIYTHI